jgi:hypothetical protein
MDKHGYQPADRTNVRFTSRQQQYESGPGRWAAARFVSCLVSVAVMVAMVV